MLLQGAQGKNPRGVEWEKSGAAGLGWLGDGGSGERWSGVKISLIRIPHLSAVEVVNRSHIRNAAAQGELSWLQMASGIVPLPPS